MKKIFYSQKYCLITMLCLLSFSTAFAISAPRWKVAAQGIKNSDYYKSIAVIDDDTIYVLLNTAKVLKTTNGGESWTTTNLPTWVGTNLQPRAICFPTASVGYVAGDKNIAKTTDYGKTWTMLAYIPATNITSAFATSETTCYFGGTAVVYYTTDGGSNFSSSIAIGNGASAIFVTPNGTLLRGGGDGGIYKSTDNGATFPKISGVTTTPFIDNSIPSVYFSTNDIGYAVGLKKTGSAPFVNNILKTTNGGSTWSGYALGSGSTVNTKGPNAVCIPATGDGFVVGTISNAAGDTYIRKTTDAGLTFSIDTVGAKSTDYYAVAVTPRGDVYVAGNGYLLTRKIVSITVASNDNDMGGVSSANGSYYVGENISVTASPNSGYHFVNWTEGGIEKSTTATYNYPVAASKTLVANFEPNTVALSSGAINASAITCTTCDVTVASGAELTVGANKTLKSVTVAAGGKLTFSGGALTATNGITLESDASGTATIKDSYTVPTISAIVKQQVEAGRNWYVSSPISTGNASVLSRGDSVIQYNEALKKWEKVTGNLSAGRGYIQTAVASRGSSGTVDFSGLTNSGTIPVTVTRTESGSSRGFNLVGNPYPSYLDWSLVIADLANANIGTSFWYRTKNTSDTYVFVTHNGTSGEVVGGTTANTTITKFIPPMQSFWVRVNPNGGNTTYSTSITFKNGMREHRDNNGNLLKAPKLNNRMRLRLQVSNGTSSDESLLYFDANAQDSFDNYDSPKMFANVAAKPEIFTKAGSEKLVINGMNEIPYDSEISVGFVTNAAGNYSISGTELSNFNSGTRILLKDKLNPANEFELAEGVSYNFSAQPTTAVNDRFSLVFRSSGVATGLEDTYKPTAQVFVNASNQITIIAPEKGNYAIFNAVGQKATEGILNYKLHTINYKLNTGVYFVAITVNGQSEIKKVVIR